MAKIIIIGAGLTGISAAYHLERAGFYDYLLYEKEDSPGGLCRSIEQDGFTFDFTGHLLHINNDYFLSLIKQIVGLDSFEQIARRSFIYSQGNYTPYPFQINLRGLPSSTIAECISKFVLRNKTTKKPKNFRQWVLKEFGSGFGKYFFFPYQTKIFSYSIDKLTASWTSRFVPATTLTQIIDGILYNPSDTQQIGYNAQFFYPKQGGIFAWVQKLINRLANPIATNYQVKTIDTRNKTVIFTNGHHERYETLINTIPLDNLLHCLHEKPSNHIKQASDHLLCNSIINYNFGINRPHISDKHWIYFPEKIFPFYRLGFQHNFSNATTPSGHSALYGECSFLHKSKHWQQQLLANAIHKTKQLLNLASPEIVTEKIITIPHAYVIYDAWREKNLPVILAHLKKLDIHSVGRYGQWKYSSMQEAILDGKAIAETLTFIPARKSLFDQQTWQIEPTRNETTPQ